MSEVARHVVFGGDMFAFLAGKYKIIDPSLPNCSDRFKLKTDFTPEIGDAIVLLSYSYRPAIRKQILRLMPMILEDENTLLYVNIFCYRTFFTHSSFKFLAVCSLISELCLFRYFNNSCVNGMQDYICPALKYFRTTYEMVLQKQFKASIGWRQIQGIGRQLCATYKTLQTVVDKEDPFNPISFLDSFSRMRSESEVSNQATEPEKEMETAEILDTQNTNEAKNSRSCSPSHDRSSSSEQSMSDATTKSTEESNASSLLISNDNVELKVESILETSLQTSSFQQGVSDSFTFENKEPALDNSNKSETQKEILCIPESEITDTSKQDDIQVGLPSDGAFSFGSIDEIKNLITEDIDESAVVFDERCFDTRNEVKLAEASLLSDKNIRFAGLTAAKESSTTVESTQAIPLINDLSDMSLDKSETAKSESKEESESEVNQDTSTVNTTRQPKKKGKRKKSKKR